MSGSECEGGTFPSLAQGNDERKKEKVLECSWGWDGVGRKEKRQQRGEPRGVGVAHGSEEGESNAGAESLTGRKLSYSEAWWPDLEIDSLVSWRQRLTTLAFMGHFGMDQGRYPV